MNKSIKLIVAAAAAMFAFASCAHKETNTVPSTPPSNDGGVYSDK